MADEAKDEAKSQPRAESGVGSVATFGPRLLAFLIDGIVADLISLVINHGVRNGGARQTWSPYLAFLLIELVFVAFAGQTPGMRVLKIAVVRQDGQGRARPQWVLLRTVLLAALIPPLITDRAGRGMHDRAAGTVMLRVG